MSREIVERNVKRDSGDACQERRYRGMSRETVERNVKRDGRDACQERL